MQSNEEIQGAMPSLNDMITSEDQGVGQTNYSYSRKVQDGGNSKITTIVEEPETTKITTRKVVTSQQPMTESSYYSKRVTKTTTTTTTSTRGNEGHSTQTSTSRYSNTGSSGVNRNQTSSYTRPGGQTTKTTTTTTTTVQRGQYGQGQSDPSTNTTSQVYRGNQRTVQPPTKIGNSQSFSGNRYQPKRPETNQSYKQKARSPEPGSLKRKTINRGDPVENVQITHIIFTSRPTDFHITEELNLDNLSSEPIKISQAERAKLQRSGKVTATCSCDGVEIAQPKKVNLKGNTTIYQHARGIGMTNDRKENINPDFYSSEIKKLDPIYKQKEKEKVEIVENFRSTGKVYKNPPSTTNAATKSTTYNRGSKYTQNQNNRSGATNNRGGMSSTTNTRGGMANSTSYRGGMGSSTSNRGGVGSSVKTTTSYVRGNNYGAGGDGEIIKETNTRVQMGSRSNKNPSQSTTYTTTERKVYNQKNFFNK